MMAWIILAIGLVLVVEGLVFALAPSRLEDLVRVIAAIPAERRRAMGLFALALGVFLVWIARLLGV